MDYQYRLTRLQQEKAQLEKEFIQYEAMDSLENLQGINQLIEKLNQEIEEVKQKNRRH